MNSLPIGPQAGGMLGHLFESLATLCVRVCAQAAEAAVGHFRTLASTVDDRDLTHLRWLGGNLGADLLDAVVINTGLNAYRRPDGIGVVPLALLGP